MHWDAEGEAISLCSPGCETVTAGEEEGEDAGAYASHPASSLLSGTCDCGLCRQPWERPSLHTPLLLTLRHMQAPRTFPSRKGQTTTPPLLSLSLWLYF